MEKLLENIEKGMTQGLLTGKELEEAFDVSYNYYAGKGMGNLRGPGNLYVLINKKTGKWRLFSKGNTLTISDEDINFKAIEQKCPHYKKPDKTLDYGRLRIVDLFDKGWCALKWIIYPGGSPSEGSSEDNNNNEESACCIIDEDLNIIVPFRPFKDVKRALKRRRKRQGANSQHVGNGLDCR